jgi:hypothetical protein
VRPPPNHHVRNLAPVKRRTRAVRCQCTAVRGWIATKATEISDDRPDKRTVVTPHLFSIVDKHAADDLRWITEKSGITSDISASCKMPNFENPPIRGRPYGEYHLGNPSLAYRTHRARFYVVRLGGSTQRSIIFRSTSLTTGRSMAATPLIANQVKSNFSLAHDEGERSGLS